MFEEALRKEVPKEGWAGGLIIDEMAIQSDIQIHKSGDIVELAGFTNYGEEGNVCKILRTGSNDCKVGTHVLQIIFIGLTGFRFPLCHFVTDQIQAPELYTIFCDAVDLIERYGFQILYTCMDGAQCNRTFMHINMHDSPDNYVTTSPCSLNNVVLMMDFSHVVKKMRNNIIKSGVQEGCTRNLTLANGDTIQWQMFKDAYNWDLENALAIHRKLTHEHLYPNTQEKMRNHLAEEVLNLDMLNLLKQYQSYLGQKGAVLNGAVELVSQTATFIQIFRDVRPVKNTNDDRLNSLSQICKWFSDWKTSVEQSNHKNKYARIMSLQCHEDIQACGIGFIQLCKIVEDKFKSAVYICPALINSDVVENHFNQQRSTYNGANTNPNILQYSKTQNSIMLGQTNISRKGNAYKSKLVTQPYGFSINQSLKRKVPAKSDTDTEYKKLKVVQF